MCLEEIRIWICMPTVYVSTLSNLFCPILADGVTVAARACQPFDCTDFENCVSLLSVKQITLWFLRETYLVQHRRISIMRTSMLMYETTKPVLAHTDFPSMNPLHNGRSFFQSLAAPTLFLATSRYSVFQSPMSYLDVTCTVLHRWLVPSFDLYISHLFIICHVRVYDTSILLWFFTRK